MVNLYNSAEGGTNGTNVTVGNSGGASGNPFFGINAGTGSIKFNYAVANSGNYSYNFGPGPGSVADVSLYNASYAATTMS